jgi:opacity protein-like surface antigen
MKRQVKIGSVVLMIVMLSTLAAAAVQKPVVQQAGATHQLVIGAQDAITASDAGGGTLSTRDLLIITALGVGLVILILVL